MARTAVLLALGLAAIAVASAQDTTGKTLPSAPGYTFGSDIAGYLKVSDDVCEYKAALAGNAPDFATARAIYTNGKNSKKSNGQMRTLKGMATSKRGGEPFADIFIKYFGSPTYLDDLVTKALAGTAPFSDPLARRELAMKGAEMGTIMHYMIHELDEAMYKIKDLKELDAAEGAPHNVDETVALYVGGKTECALFTTSNKRAKAFGTLATCQSSKANQAILAAMKDAQAAAGKGNLAAFMAARQRIISLLTVTAVQATIEYAELTEAARAAGKPTDELQAEGYAFFHSIEALVAQASPSSAATIKKLLYPGNPVVPGLNKQVTEAFAKAYAGLGITAADVGTYGAKSAVAC